MFTLIDTRPDDSAFLYELYASAKLEEMAERDWPAEGHEDFVRVQYKAQQQYYSQQYPQSCNKIIVCNGQRAGRILTARSGAEMAVLDLVLLPAFRNQGLGTALLRELQGTAKAEGLALSLHVMFNNPARHLYLRLGFCDDGTQGPYIRMRWS